MLQYTADSICEERRGVLQRGGADDGMLLALLSLYVFKCNEVSVLYYSAAAYWLPASLALLPSSFLESPD